MAAWPDKAVLAFRGTSGAGDVLTDLNVFKDGKVHAGFQRKLESMWREQIRAVLDGLDESIRSRVSATGHSLGGAMAMLAGLRWPFDQIVTFGAPRVGAGIGSAFLAGQVVRYVNGADKVPDMPPEALGYEHHGELVTLVDPNGPSLRYDHAIVYYAEILEM